MKTFIQIPWILRVKIAYELCVHEWQFIVSYNYDPIFLMSFHDVHIGIHIELDCIKGQATT